MDNLNHPYAFKNSKIFIGILFLVFYPLGVYKIWKQSYPRWVQAAYIILGLPVFLIVFIYFTIVLAGTMLPDLDRSTSPHLDRTVWNKEGNYSCTFIKTKSETGDAYELMQVGVEAKGGNWWHYHSTFDEEFTVVSGELTVETEGKKQVIKKGESTVVPKTKLHQFHNATDSVTTVLVRVTPAAGLEKTIRIAYGLINKGEMGRNSSTANPWHLFLLGGYSNSYPPPILPTWIQEPFVDGLAKIAQWKGEDKALEVYFK
jgi:quercetin dioxygenase-like cupin family protein